MILQYKTLDNKIEKISFGEITNIVGQNIKGTNYFMDYFIKYFTGYRYNLYEEEKYNYEVEILIDGEEVGRRYIEVYEISKESIENMLSFTKGNILYNYLMMLFEDVSIKENIDKVSEQIELMNIKLHDRVENSLKDSIHIDSNEITESIILKNFIKGYVEKGNIPINHITNEEKILLVLKIIEQLNKKNNNLKCIAIKDIDKLISIEDFEVINNEIIRLSESNNLTFITSSSTEGYISGNTKHFKYINIFGDLNITMPEIHELTEYVNRSYPTNKCFNEEEVCKIIKKIAPLLLSEKIDFKMNESYIVLKLINSCYGVYKKESKTNLTSCEIEFLKDY